MRRRRSRSIRSTHRVTANGQPVALGPTEFRLLRFLLARPERVHSRAQLLDQVWGDHVYIEERTVDVHIRRLRLALEPFGQRQARSKPCAGAAIGSPRRAERASSCVRARRPLPRARSRRLHRVLVADGVFGFAGAAWAFGVLALGWGALLVDHVVNLRRLDGLGARSPRRRGARGRRRLARRMFRDLPPVALRRAHERDLTHTIERFQSAAEAIPDGMVVLDAHESHQVGESPRAGRSSGSICARIRARRSSTSCASPSSCVSGVER